MTVWRALLYVEIKDSDHFQTSSHVEARFMQDADVAEQIDPATAAGISQELVEPQDLVDRFELHR